MSDIARRQSLSVEEEECECAIGSDVHGRLDRANGNVCQTHIRDVHGLRKQYSLERWYSGRADELSSS